MSTRRDIDLELGMRPDGAPWRIRVIEFAGTQPGPTTAFVAGVWGDKPLAVMTLWSLARQLEREELSGTVVLIPAANPPAIAAGTRVNPDHAWLNRTFPGSAHGGLTAQLAHLLVEELVQRADCVVDLHSGTATMGLGYTYDYDDLELSAAFGYLPVIPGFAQAGQLSAALVERGVRSCLVEFGGAEQNSTDLGIRGCLNVLGFRGHLDHQPSGPSTVPLIDRVSMFLPRYGGVLGSSLTPSMIGHRIGAGVVAWVDCPGTGERLDEHELDDDDGILLLANTTPLLVEPGAFGCSVGYSDRSIDVPGHRGATP